MANLIPVEGSRSMSPEQIQAVDNAIRLRGMKEWFQKPKNWMQTIAVSYLGLASLSPSAVSSQEILKEFTEPKQAIVQQAPSSHSVQRISTATEIELATTTSTAKPSPEISSPEIFNQQEPQQVVMFLDERGIFRTRFGKLVLDSDALEAPPLLKTITTPEETQQGITMVPLRAAAEGLGAKILWNGVTETATIQKGKRIIDVKKGSSSASVIDEVGGKTTIPLSTPAEIINGRLMVPLRSTGEAFGVSVNWDKTSRAIGLGFKNRETFETTAQATDEGKGGFTHLMNALYFKADGAYTDANNPSNLIIESKQKGTIIFSKGEEKRIGLLKGNRDFSSASDPKKALREFYTSNSKAGYLASSLQEGETMFITAKQVYKFSLNEATKEKEAYTYDEGKGEWRRVEYNENKPHYNPSVLWYDDVDTKGNHISGLVATDGVRITHMLNETTKEFEELDYYIPLGDKKNPELAAKQRAVENLKFLVKDEISRKSFGVDSDMDLEDMNEAITTGNLENRSSFEVVGGEIIVLKSGKNKIIANLQRIREAFDRFKQIDPDNITLLATQLGLRTIGRSIYGKGEELFASSYSSHLGFVGIRENNENYLYPPKNLMAIFLGEARAISSYQHTQDFISLKRKEYLPVASDNHVTEDKKKTVGLNDGIRVAKDMFMNSRYQLGVETNVYSPNINIQIKTIVAFEKAIFTKIWANYYGQEKLITFSENFAMNDMANVVYTGYSNFAKYEDYSGQKP